MAYTPELLFDNTMDSKTWSTFVTGSTANNLFIQGPVPFFDISTPTVTDDRYLKLLNSINSFKDLKQNWDSYNANAISPTAIIKAIEILGIIDTHIGSTNTAHINVFPMRDGGVQFEFDDENAMAEIEIGENGQLNLIIYNNEGDITVEDKLSDPYSVLDLFVAV